MKPKFPFEAAIFDLDGTLLDSMYVWKRVDEIFFENMGMECPADYGAALAGKSYRESAEYTIERFGLTESWEEIVRGWTELAHHEYAENVGLKPGAREYLTLLRRSGVKLAVATALPEYLYRPCLAHLGILDWFDALCSTDDTGGRGKSRGEVFLLAAQRLGVEAEKCVVFEDVLEGIRGARCAGMGACCVLEEASRHAHAEIAPIAHRMIADFTELLPKRRCVIFTARCEGAVEVAYSDRRESDLILCADAGYELARQAGVEPDWIIGDFDSAQRPGGDNILVHPVIKDDTDTVLCARFALEEGVRDFRIVGGVGGRLDHTLANLQTLAFLTEQGAHAELCDGNVQLVMLKNGSLRIPRTPGKLSVFAFGGTCSGVTISGAKYNVENATLTPSFPLGMGNDFAADFAEISVKEGRLLVLWELKNSEA